MTRDCLWRLAKLRAPTCLRPILLLRNASSCDQIHRKAPQPVAALIMFSSHRRQSGSLVGLGSRHDRGSVSTLVEAVAWLRLEAIRAIGTCGGADRGGPAGPGISSHPSEPGTRNDTLSRFKCSGQAMIQKTFFT